MNKIQAHKAEPGLVVERSVIDDQGRAGQKATNGKRACWIDYSNEVDDVTEGLAVFIPASGGPREWLTREYGTFGPRRADKLNGTRFSLQRGEVLEGRAGILVHRGNCDDGRVAMRYRAYAEGK